MNWLKGKHRLGYAFQPNKTHKPANIFPGVLFVLSLLYPFIVYYFVDTWPPFYFITGIAALLLLRALLSCRIKKKSAQPDNANTLYFACTLIVILFALYFWNQQLAPLCYPVMMSLVLAVIMGLTLIYPPSMIERFARIKEPNLDANGVRYTRKVTIVWMCFGIINAMIAYGTVLLNDRAIWVLYNGCIAYILIGLLVAGEYLVRRHHKRKK